eukprot:gene12824-15053_t
MKDEPSDAEITKRLNGAHINMAASGEIVKVVIDSPKSDYVDNNIKPSVSNYHLIEAKKELATRLREYCEMSVITCSRPLVTRPRTASLPSPALTVISTPTTPIADYDFEFEISKSYRCDYLNSILSFVQTLSNISKKLISIPIDLRGAKLKDEISSLNIKLPLGLYLPMWQSSQHHCIVRIPPEEVKILNSRERVPFLLVLEIIEGEEEASAANILKIFQEIWAEERLPLFLRPYSILVTSASSGIIETINDTVSLHNLKKNTPNYTTLLNHFKATYGDGTEAFRDAQAKFVESMAAYSIVTYLLQVKDRHNGNILLDKEGHIIHIDFGFILSNSPGGMSFESAPFKLTQDLLDVMGGTQQTPMFHYFQALFVRGFLMARKHFDKFASFIELMMTGPKMSCFQGGRDF